jgi:membrane protein
VRPRATLIKKDIGLLRRAYQDWDQDEASRLAASLSFYTILSLAPLLVIVVAIAGLVFGEEAARGELSRQFAAQLGQRGATAIEAILASSKSLGGSLFATIAGVFVLLFGASGVFGELQASLNRVWDVKTKPGRGLKGILHDRFLSFTMVLAVAFLLLVSLILTAVLAAANDFLGRLFGLPPLFWQAVNLVVGFAFTTVLFAMIFKTIPDAIVAWRDVWVGSLVTAGLFSLGKYLIGLYIGMGSTASAYGAAGSLVAVVIWVYYSAQILFFGAELTQAYATARGATILPKPNAVALHEDGD